ncbi:MAG: AAA family ATPase [Hydrogenobacter sp.]
MRPILLRLENFTAYTRPQEIDFSDLNFFIIQGKTGAGKTSIIEAICYALYGKVPRYKGLGVHEHLLSKGQRRMRVYFEFSVKGKRYAVDRLYEVSKSPVVRFYEGSKLLNLKVKEVEEYISKLLSMDYETFTKVIVLPQGQFDRFLKPNKPVERREILNRLLGYDEIFEKMNRIIKDTLSQLRIKKESLDAEYESIKYAQEGILREKEEELKKKRQNLEHLTKEKEDLSALLQKAIEKERLQKELSERESELSKLLSLHEDIQKKREKLYTAKEVLDYAPSLKEYEELSENIHKLTEEKKLLNMELLKYKDELTQMEEERKRLEQEYTKLDELRSKERELEITKERLIALLDLQKKINQTLTQIEDREKQRNRLKDELGILQEDLSQKEKQLSDIEQKLLELENVEEEYAKLTAIKSIYDQLPHIYAEIEKTEELLKQNKERLVLLESDVKNLEGSLFEAYVHEIKSKLLPGDICPVCGNEVHKIVTHHRSEDLSFAQIREKLESLRKEEQNIINSLGGYENRIKELRQKHEEILRSGGMSQQEFYIKYEEIKKKYHLYKSLKEKEKQIRQVCESSRSKKSEKEIVLSKLEASLEHAKEHLSELKNQEETEMKRLSEILGRHVRDPKRELGLLEEDLGKIKGRIASVQHEYENLRKYMEELRIKASRIEEQIKQKERLKEDMRTRLAEVGKTLYPALQKFGDIEKLKELCLPKEEVQRLEKEVIDYERHTESLKTQIERLKNILSGYPQELSRQRIEEKLKDLDKVIYRVNQEMGILIREVQEIREKIERRKAIEQEIIKLSRELWKYEALEKDMRSEKFPEFVSRHMLQTILDRASFYLLKFSSGIYEFKLTEGDLCVIDRSSGHERSVFTLSGGETFIASLSLAFAVSDVISHSAPLESMFIDEGFGALDRETRESLGEFFELIKLNAGRMVGIISHLEDLAEKFDQKIVVEKRGDYSTIRVEVI